MRLSPLAAVAAACLLTLTACGDDGDEPSSDDKSPSASESGEPSGKDTKGPEGDETTEPGDANPQGATVCDSIDLEAVGEIVGNDLEMGNLEGQSCLLTNPQNPSATSIGLNELPLSSVGGIEGAKSSLGAIGGAKPEEVPDVGDAAFVGVGDGLLGRISGSGVVIVDETMVQVNVTPDQRLKKPEVKEQTIAIMELVAEGLESE